MPSEQPADLTLRPAVPQDVGALARLLVDARAAAYPAIPHPVHPPEDVRRWLRGRVEVTEDRIELWVAERDDRPVALLLLEESWVHSLYVAPGLTGQGIGSALLDLAKGLRPDGLGLWVFETNERALRFYRRHGFGELRRTDGSENEEGEPDVEMAWPAPSSLEDLRRQVDALDDRLAQLLAERAGLTARIQRVKAVPGRAGRDREREAQIVSRMARLAPGLGEERLGRIMDRVISESLDAAQEGRRVE